MIQVFGLMKEILKLGLCFLVVKNIEKLFLSQNICLRIITLLHFKINSDIVSPLFLKQARWNLQVTSIEKPHKKLISFLKIKTCICNWYLIRHSVQGYHCKHANRGSLEKLCLQYCNLWCVYRVYMYLLICSYIW